MSDYKEDYTLKNRTETLKGLLKELSDEIGKLEPDVLKHAMLVTGEYHELMRIVFWEKTGTNPFNIDTRDPNERAMLASFVIGVLSERISDRLKVIEGLARKIANEEIPIEPQS